MLVCALHGLKYCQGAAMQSLYPVEKAIRLGGPLSIGGQGQELRYVSDLYIPAHGILADAVRPRYAAISALPSRQQFLYFVALCVRANGADPTQHSSLFTSSPNAAPRSPLMRQSVRVIGLRCWLPLPAVARPPPRGRLPGRLRYGGASRPAPRGRMPTLGGSLLPGARRTCAPTLATSRGLASLPRLLPAGRGGG